VDWPTPPNEKNLSLLCGDYFQKSYGLPEMHERAKLKKGRADSDSPFGFGAVAWGRDG